MVEIAVSFLLLLTYSLRLAKSAGTEVLPRQVRSHIEGITYESLRDVLQSYPVDRRNTDQTWKLFRTCKGLSGFREITHTDSDLTRQSVSKPCYSVLQNCRFDESMEDYVSFCVSGDQHRRYDFMEIDKNQKLIYGRNLTGNCPSSRFENYLSAGVWYPCMCDCESSVRIVDRYFSLLDVVSDDDKVVTGVRFRKVDHVFYIQIQQARLGWNQVVRGKPKWKDIKHVAMFDLLSSNVSENYEQEGYDDNLLKFHKNDFVYAVTSEQNTVLLDDLEGGSNEVVTGLRFRQVGQDLRFEIQVTPFDDDTGTLNRNASRWVHRGCRKSRRLEVDLQSVNVPERYEISTYSSFGCQFVRFRVSDFKTDLGQTTVPFIEITDTVADQPQPLSGAGIFHYSSRSSAGFLGLRVFFRT